MTEVKEWHVAAAREWWNDADFVTGMSETIAAHDLACTRPPHGAWAGLRPTEERLLYLHLWPA